MKKKDKTECTSHNIVFHCVDTLLEYEGQTGLKYSDIRASRKIHTTVRSLHNSQKQVVITDSFSKYTSVV